MVPILSTERLQFSLLKAKQGREMLRHLQKNQEEREAYALLRKTKPVRKMLPINNKPKSHVWGPPGLLIQMGTVTPSHEQSSRSARLITYLHLVPKLRMSGVIRLPPPLYASMAWTRTALLFYFYV